MTSRERVLKAIRFEGPDRVPVIHNHLPGALLRHGQALIDIFLKYPNDFYDTATVLSVPVPDKAHYLPDGSYFKEERDEWGCVWRYYQEGMIGEVAEAPLQEWTDLAAYRFPEVSHAGRESRLKLREENERIKERFCAYAAAGNIFERMQWLRGVENLFIDIALGNEEVEILADLLLEKWLIPNIETGIEAGAEIIGFADDWGSQQQLLINPSKWRSIFKPRYRKMFDLVHQGGGLAWMHSDGMIMEIIPDLIEIGLDVLNFQTSLMDMDELRRLTRGKICLQPDIDRQYTLPFGTPAEVQKLVAEIMTAFHDPRGGLIMGGEVGPDVPLCNVEAMLASIYERR
ncbi:MAG: uroporphyrinogen decarboxylase family protein [bacterium]|nr:uroporphyrinogen decarboxylase family protein [bacterium]